MSATKDYELKKILTKVIDEGKKLTDKDIEFLVIQFREKFGFSHGIALNPQLLLDDIEIGEALEIEEEEFDEWKHQDILNEFDEKSETKLENIGIEILCEEPKKCNSFINNPYSCNCIRTNFDSPESFRKWRDLKIEELSSKLTKLTHKK